jgi:STE24 endopeptidase
MIGGFILTTLLGYYLLDSVAKILNLRNLTMSPPPEFGDVYDEYRYRRSQEYTRMNTWFEIAVSTTSLAVLLVVWFLGGFEILDQWVRSLHVNSLMTGLLYVGTLGVTHELLSLPFKIYQTFVIEQRYGFNQTKPQTFIMDQLRDWILSGVLLASFLAIVLSLLEWLDVRAWIVAWLCTAAISILLQYLAPRFILPLYFKFTPVPAGELRDRVTELCAKEQFSLSDLLVIDGSRRSAKANAFFTGFGANKKIALYDTLINNYSITELVAVLAHEIGHSKKHHVIQHFLLGLFNLFILFFAASLCISRPELFAAFGVTTPSYYVGLVLFVILVQPVGILLGILSNFWSRKHEFEADRFAAESLEDPTPLINALKKLSKDSLSNLTPHPLHVGLHFSHPPVLTRVQALMALNPTLVQAGTRDFPGAVSSL